MAVMDGGRPRRDRDLSVFPDGWLQRHLEKQKQENTIQVQYNPETNKMKIAIVDGGRNETFEISREMDSEKWEKVIECFKNLNEETADHFPDDIFKVD